MLNTGSDLPFPPSNLEGAWLKIWGFQWLWDRSPSLQEQFRETQSDGKLGAELLLPPMASPGFYKQGNKLPPTPFHAMHRGAMSEGDPSALPKSGGSDGEDWVGSSRGAAAAGKMFKGCW